MNVRFRVLLLIVLMASVFACSAALAQTTPSPVEAPAAFGPATENSSRPHPPAEPYMRLAPAERVAEPQKPTSPAALPPDHRRSGPLDVVAANTKLPLAIVKHDDYRDWVSAQLFM